MEKDQDQQSDVTLSTESTSETSSIATSASQSTMQIATPSNPLPLPSLAKSWAASRAELIEALGNDNSAVLGIFQAMHESGIPKSVLVAIAALSIPEREGRDDWGYEGHVELLAIYLAGQHPYSSKLDCVRLMLTLDPCIPEGLRPKEAIVRSVLDFLQTPEHATLPLGTDEFLFWEIRAKCLHFQTLQQEEFTVLKFEHVVQGGEAAAECIVGAAKLFEQGLAGSVPVINGSLEIAGDNIKQMLTPAEKPLISSQSGDIALGCTGAARLATDGVRETAKRTVYGIRDASTRGISMAAKNFENQKIGHKIVPHKGCRDTLVTAGKIGVAGLGAAAIVGEAIFEATKSVAQKTVSVTADVVRHKFGDSAGRVVEDAGETTGNILRTITHVAMLEKTVLTKSVAKNAGKVQVVQGTENQDEGKDWQDRGLPFDPVLLVDTTQAAAMEVVEKLRHSEKAESTRRLQSEPSLVATSG